MKKVNVIMISICLLFAINTYGQKNKNNTKKPMTNKSDSISYVLGQEVGGYYLSQEILVDSDQFMQGFVDAFKKTSAIDQATKEKIIQQFQMEQQAKQQAKTAQKSGENKAKGTAFLENNKKNADVVTTPSGLQYKVVKQGAGEHPKATDVVKVHYHGTLIDGTVFDSSVQRNEPATFPLNRVIPGWTEGVQLMTPGSKFTFYIPSNLAYGDRETGAIAPGSTLIFEVELLEINPK
jgi:FKBP-type peptidyl-prolyl cis-trans isomerase FkpA